MSDSNFISDKPELTLPHRPPFLWVTRLIDRSADGKAGLVELDLSSDIDVFRGHFPGNPLFPGVLQMEAGAQACLWVLLGERDPGAKMPEVLFVAVDTYKFKAPVVPPTTLGIHVQQTQTRGPLQYWEIQIKIQGKLVSQGAFWLRITTETVKES